MEMRATSAIGNRGFTLLELLVVLSIMVLMATAWPFAAPRLFPAQQLRNQAQRLVSLLAAARMSARTQGLTQRVAITSSGRLIQSSLTTDTLPHGMTASVRTGTGLPDAVLFYADGSSSGAVIDLGIGDRISAVSVGRIVGQAQVLE
jgi:type II secretion system protein H